MRQWLAFLRYAPQYCFLRLHVSMLQLVILVDGLQTIFRAGRTSAAEDCELQPWKKVICFADQYLTLWG